MKVLRPYQDASIASMFAWLYNREGFPLMVLPVAAGKSLIIADIIKRTYAKWASTKIVVLAHVKELLIQNSDELKEYYPECDYGFYCAGLKKKELHNSVTFASIQSVYSKAFDFPICPDLILVDEAHLISHNDQTQYRRFIDDVLSINPRAKLVGLTGTPYRADTGRLDRGDKCLFHGICYNVGIEFMVEHGYLAKPVVPANDLFTMDTEGVKKRGGDFIQGQLAAAVNVDEVTQACVQEVLDKAQDRNKILVFTVAIDHCNEVVKALNAVGISSKMVIGDTPTAERDEILQEFKDGKFRCLVNVAVLTTGFNVPDIDCLVFMRPTRSPVLYVQCMGRGLRAVYAPGYDLKTKDGRLKAIAASHKKDCLILDFGGIISALGPVDQVGIEKIHKHKEPDEMGEGLFKTCPSCEATCHLSARYCFECSYKFFEDQIETNAETNKKPMSEPIIASVMAMQCYKHYKRDEPDGTPSMQVQYATSQGPVSEYICFEHWQFSCSKAYAYQMAEEWHHIRFPEKTCPSAVDAALQLNYPIPKAITIRKEGKYWRIIDYNFEIEEEKRSEEIPF